VERAKNLVSVSGCVNLTGAGAGGCEARIGERKLCRSLSAQPHMLYSGSGSSGTLGLGNTKYQYVVLDLLIML